MPLANALLASTNTVIPLLRSMFRRNDNETSVAEIFSDLAGVRSVTYRAWPTNPSFTAAWNDLLSRVETAAVFQTAAWQQAVLAWPQRLDRLILITCWRGSSLIGVLPLQSARGGRAESAGAVVSDYLDPLVDPASEQDFWRATLKCLRDLPDAPKEITLRNLRAQASCRTTLPSLAAEEGFSVQEQVHGSCCFLKLPRTWDEYLAMLPSGDRKELRRKLSKAEAQAGAVLEREADAPGNLERARRVFSLIESGGGTRGMKCRWIFRGLLDNSGEALAEQQWLRVFSLGLGDRPSAGIITFRARNGMMAWATAYNADDRKWSPGIVTFAMMIRRAIEEGCEYVDLLRGDSDYKMRLGAEKRPLYEMTLSRTA